MSTHFQSGEGVDESHDLYALRALDPAAEAEVAAHLERGCGECLRAQAGAQARLAALALTAAQEEPSLAVRQRLIEALRPARSAPAPRARRSLWNWAWGGVAGALAVLLVVALLHTNELVRRQRALEAIAAGTQVQLRLALASNQQLRLANEIVGSPAAIVLAVKAAPTAPSARAFLDPRRGVVLIASNLAPAAPGKTYQMWLLPTRGKPIPAGTFQSSASGAAAHTFAQSFSGVAGVAVSIEPEGGSAQPTGAIVLAAKVPAS